MKNIYDLSPDMIEPLVIGGSILGGGGGGSIKEGLKMGKLAFEVGQPKLISIDELDQEDTIITVSAVGAPAAKDQFVFPMDYVKAVNLLTNTLEKSPKAMITNENGGIATVNGLFQSAITGIPILDVACNGRAHPTGLMGSIRLNELPDYVSTQASVGGKPNTPMRMNHVAQGNIEVVSKLTRQVSIEAGGFVAVARNPVSMKYLKSNGAIKALSQALELGIEFLKGESPYEKIDNIVNLLNGEVILRGKVKELVRETKDGFDLGIAVIETDEDAFELTIWNEYMTCENSNGQRIATFPDLLMTFDSYTGQPITSADIEKNQDITVIFSSKDNLILGSGMFSKNNYIAVEKVLNKKIIDYIPNEFWRGVDKNE